MGAASRHAKRNSSIVSAAGATRRPARPPRDAAHAAALGPLWRLDRALRPVAACAEATVAASPAASGVRHLALCQRQGRRQAARRPALRCRCRVRNARGRWKHRRWRREYCPRRGSRGRASSSPAGNRHGRLSRGFPHTPGCAWRKLRQRIVAPKRAPRELLHGRATPRRAQVRARRQDGQQIRHASVRSAPRRTSSCLGGRWRHWRADGADDTQPGGQRAHAVGGKVARRRC